ncbi:MAG: sigma-70 family RNA polymerase sigma factor [Phycisphaerales bacterium]
MREAHTTPDPQSQDPALVEACLKGDRRAWASLIDRYGRLVYSVPSRRGLPPEACEDVFQDVFAILLKELPRLRDAASLPKWLITTAVRESARAARRAGPTASVLPDVQAQPPPEEELAAAEERQRIREALDLLGDPCRALLVALFGPEKPDYSTIARRLDMPVGSIGPTRARCLAKLAAIVRSRESA